MQQASVNACVIDVLYCGRVADDMVLYVAELLGLVAASLLLVCY